MQSKRVLVLLPIIFTILLLSGCTKTELYSSYEPCKGAYFGGDMPAYKQTETCKAVCELHGLEYFNKHCFDYLKCSCVAD